MVWMRWVLLESAWALGILLFVANFVLLVYWRRSGRPRPLLIGLGVAAALLIVQALVVTRPEHARRVMAGIEDDVLNARTGNLAAALAPTFAAGSMNADDFIDFVQRQYNHVRVRDLHRVSLQIRESQSDRFVAAVAYWAEITVSDYAGMVQTSWDITFVQTPNGWQVNAIDPTHIPGHDRPDWGSLDRPW